MPIDYLSQKRVEEQKLKDLITQRKPLDIRGIQSARAKTGIPLTRTGDLDFALGQRQASSALSNERTKLNLLFENALQMAEDRGLSLRDSEEFARNVVQDEVLRGREREGLKTRIDKARRLSDIEEEFTGRGLELEERYSGTDSSDALTRILFGLGTSIGTSYLLGRKFRTPAKTKSPAQVAGAGGYEPYDRYYGKAGRPTAGVGGYGGY